MAKTIIVWFRNDLRIHDHPALSTAVHEADFVIPLFIYNKSILEGNHSGSNRNRFLHESLADLRASLTRLGADLVVREGEAGDVLLHLSTKYRVSSVYCTADYSPLALKRDKLVQERLKAAGIQLRLFPGRLIVSTLDMLRTKAGTPHKVFTPFWKNWQQVKRREIASTPDVIKIPDSLDTGSVKTLQSITINELLSPDALPGGEVEGRKRLQNFLEKDIQTYAEKNNMLADDSTSRLSAYLHFGCLSPREIELMIPDGTGAAAWHRQLCWRDFYHYILYNNPSNSYQSFQERYRNMQWDVNPVLLNAWQMGMTGYPVVDAAMRQLRKEGWMHNRARLIVGSFLVKDLWLDWRLGEKYFMQWLIDGDQANNNGNWQWIASVGVDPAPVFRRLYNPSSQQASYDPHGAYVRKYVTELSHVPDAYLVEPWKMPKEIQEQSNCIIGQDYPLPIVDHKAARVAALERYREA